MNSDAVRRAPRIVLAVLAAALAAIAALAAGAPGAPPARAATAAPDITLSLSPDSGSDYASDQATLSWNVPSACVGQELAVFLYQGAGLWDTAAINEAAGNDGGQETYFGFFLAGDATATATSASWPDVTSGYTPYGASATPMYDTTAELVQALGTGLYTIGVACVNATSGAPILDSSGNPEAGSVIVDIGASGDSWALDPGVVATGTTLTSTSVIGSNTLTATVVTGDGSAPDGSVNFYPGAVSGTPINSAPVPVSSDGTAQWTGQLPVPGGGDQPVTAQFVPAPGSADAGSQDTESVLMLVAAVTLRFTAVQDPVTPADVDVTATQTVTAGSLQSATGFDLSVDGNLLTGPGGGSLEAFPANGVASYTVQGLANGAHAIDVLYTVNGAPGLPISSTGIEVTESPAAAVTVRTGPYAAPLTVTFASTHDGLRMTATATGHTSAGAATAAVPAGTVKFADGTTSLGSAALAASGTGSASASVSVFSLPAGTNDLTAAFTPSNPALFSASARSADLDLPVAETWVRAGSPVLAGTAAVGDALKVRPGTWGPGTVSLAYQWYADGSAIPGATSGTLVLSAAELGKVISADVTGYEQGDVSSDVLTPTVGPVVKGTLKSAVPLITGTARVGDTLKAVPGAWTAGTGFGYQWYAAGKPIAKATGASLKLAAAEAGSRITVAVTGTKAGYTTVTRTSAPTKPVAKG